MNTKKMYEQHHQAARRPGFSILKDERGQYFRTEIGIGKKVLDLGCRDGALTSYFMPGNTVLGVDIDESALARAQKIGIETRVLDAHGDWHELQGDLFDVVVAGEVLEHLFYPNRIVERVASFLRPTGMFIGSVPNAFSLKNRLRYLLARKKNTPLADPTHINQFSAQELKHVLSAYFDNVEVCGIGRAGWLAKRLPGLFAFDLVFTARTPRKV